MTKLQEFILAQPYGFLTDVALKEAVAIAGTEGNDRLTQVVVRCGCGRFCCAIQDAEHFVNIVTRENTDYVRDVAFTHEVVEAARNAKLAQAYQEANRKRNAEEAAKRRERYPLPAFREQDCSGVFGADGCVYSDADPGL